MTRPKNLRWQNIKPLNKHLLITIEQEEEVQKGSIILTQHYKPKNHFRILRVAADCDPVLEVNDLILVNRMNQARVNTYEVNSAEKVYLVPQTELFAIYKQGRLRPLGRNLLISRLHGDEMDLDTKVITPAQIVTKDQSLNGLVVEFGLGKEDDFLNIKGKKFRGYDFGPIMLDDHVQLIQWEMSIIELSYLGKYHLVVPESLLSHIIHDDDKLYA
jgi:co-chaperonin GroES (HSP10)